MPNGRSYRFDEYREIAQAMRSDPASLFTYKRPAERIVAYLAWVYPAVRQARYIGKAAHLRSNTSFASHMQSLAKSGLVEQTGRGLWRLAPAVMEV